MPNEPVRKDAVRPLEVEVRMGPVLIEHTVSTILDAYVTSDGEQLVLRKMRPGADQGLGVSEIRLAPESAARLNEFIRKFLAAPKAEEPTVLRPSFKTSEPVPKAQNEASSQVPDIITWILREQEEEANARSMADAAAEKAEDETEPDVSELFRIESSGKVSPAPLPYTLHRGLMPTRAPKEK